MKVAEVGEIMVNNRIGVHERNTVRVLFLWIIGAEIETLMKMMVGDLQIPLVKDHLKNGASIELLKIKF